MLKKRLFMTGGTGFFGKWLLLTRPAEYEYFILSRDPDKFLAGFPELDTPGLNFIKGDVRDFEPPREYFDYVLHAATTSGHAIPDEEMASVIMEGTRRVLQMNFGKMLYISSGGVYGRNLPPQVREDYPPAPTTVYGQNKLAAENLCRESGKPAVIARCFAFVGPYLPLDQHFAIGNFIADCLRQQTITIKGDGSPRRSYLYAQDLAEWLWQILLRGNNGRIYNVGSDDSYSIQEIAELVKSVAGTSNSIEILSSPGNHIEYYIPDISRVRNELGLTMKTPLVEAIRRTIEFQSSSLI